jgi:hypothetical protein
MAVGGIKPMSTTHGRLGLLVAALLIFSTLAGDAVHAEGLVAPLKPQPLADALEAFAKQTGMQVLYTSDVARGVRSPGASAGRSTTDTLRELLRDTNLTFQYVNERTVTVLERPRATRAAQHTGNP